MVFPAFIPRYRKFRLIITMPSGPLCKLIGCGRLRKAGNEKAVMESMQISTAQLLCF